MARKIRFPLKMQNGADVRTIEELRENFDIESVLGYYTDGKLVTWLKDRYYDAEADKITALNRDAKSFKVDICSVLGVEFQEDSEDIDIDYISRRREKLKILRSLTDDEQIIYNVDSVALNQDDLLDILDEEKKKIYLCQGEFEIPLSVSDITYIGFKNPIVTIRVTDNVNFKEKNLKFVDLYYGWDISCVTPDDEMRRAENYFMRGEYQSAVDILEKLAEQDNPRAIMLLYRIFINYIPDKNKENLYREKAVKSHEIFNAIDNISERTEKYLSLLKKLADKGNPIDEFYYGFSLYKDGFYNNGIYNSDEMMNYYLKSAEKDNVMAMSGLGHRYYYGKGVSIDYNKAIEWYTKAAEKGNTDSQNMLGDCYYYGNGVLQDYANAVEWYTKAAEKGNTDSQNMLGDCFYCGNGITQDYNKAVEWYRKAAEQGHADSQCSLGNCYYYGNSVTQDYNKAVEWYTKAAEKGNNNSQYMLGECFYYGNGVLQDYAKAVEWYTKSAEKGDTDSQYSLGYCYAHGKGVTQDYNKAVEWYTKAAEQGNSRAQCNLGYCYEKGQGVTQNRQEAVKWYQLAARNGNETAQNNLKNLGETW